MLANKDPRGFLAPIAPLAHQLIAVPIDHHEHHAPDELAAIATSLGLAATTAADVPAALRFLARPGAPARVIILGSLYLAGDVLAANDELPT